MKIPIYLTIIFLTFISCQQKSQLNTNFHHNLEEGPYPWTNDVFEMTEDDFTFAIIADLTGGERPNIYRTAISQLNRLNPTFVLSVGDLIDGGTEDTIQLEKEWDWFDKRTAELTMPFFHLGGNHDLTNPTMRKIWKKRFGPRYYHFIYKDVLFLMIDSEDYESTRMMEIYKARAKALKILNGEVEGDITKTEYYNMEERRLGGISEAQSAYFEDVLKKHTDVRWTFLLMHKPLWMREDNNGLGKLEDLISNRAYSVFNGHLHSFSHRERKGRDYTILGTTGGSQNELDSMAFDQFTLIRMDNEPVVTHLRMDGVLDKTGQVKVVMDSLLLIDEGF